MKVAVSISSNVCHGKSSGLASCLETSRRTSGVERVSCNGFITGGARPRTATIDPDSGAASTNDSRNEESGRIKSDSTLVSSRKLPKLTMYGSRASTSRSFHDGSAL
jgi:hypothetical protein